jgi:methylenetetrahydrofolate dehydrogenase (NADP+) / methenyltetrahydrofolate cyclohydrolase
MIIIDGRQIAEEVFNALEVERGGFLQDIYLGVIAAQNNPVIDSFIKIKEKAATRLEVTLVRENISDDATTEDVAGLALHLSGQCDGVIVQLPLPVGIDTDSVLSNILPDKDVDDINPATGELDKRVQAPVVEAIREIFERNGVEVEGKKACVVGEGRLVGRPAALWLESMGADVHVITHKKGSYEDLKDADIIVTGAGEPGFIKPGMIKEGVVLIDAGTSEAEGKISGDADPECAPKCSIFTPVPGGVGPIAVAMIFKNLFTLTKQK